MKKMSDEELERAIGNMRQLYSMAQSKEESARRYLNERAHELRVLLSEQNRRRKVNEHG